MVTLRVLRGGVAMAKYLLAGMNAWACCQPDKVARHGTCEMHELLCQLGAACRRRSTVFADVLHINKLLTSKVLLT